MLLFYNYNETQNCINPVFLYKQQTESLYVRWKDGGKAVEGGVIINLEKHHPALYFLSVLQSSILVCVRSGRLFFCC